MLRFFHVGQWHVRAAPRARSKSRGSPGVAYTELVQQSAPLLPEHNGAVRCTGSARTSGAVLRGPLLERVQGV